MNTTASSQSRLTQATLISALLAAVFMAAAPSAKAADTTVTQLPRVVITGKVVRAAAPVAMQIVDLPRVVVTGRRVDSNDTNLVQGGALKLVSAKL